jgi:O-antigen/teichoic acid export membrane protein
MKAPRAASNSEAIAKNSFWYGLEVLFALIATICTSVAVARHFGPTTLGYYTYVQWLTMVTGTAGTVGLPLTTRKYMSEYLGGGQPGIARSIFERTLRVQCVVSGLLTGAALIIVVAVGDVRYLWSSVFLALSIFPRTAAFIPSQANMASEDMRANIPGSLASGVLQLAVTTLTLIMGWGLAVIAAAVFLGCSLELGIKMRSIRWVYAAAPVPLPADVSHRMFRFSKQGVGLLLLNMAVWDRSDVVTLKVLNPDIRQVAFFSIAFNLVDRLLMAPQVLAESVGATVMAQFGRDRTRTPTVVSTAIKYLFLFSVPLLVGAACLSRPAIMVAYGATYAPMIAVFAVVALSAIPKALFAPGQALLQASENQRFLLGWTALCGAVNVLLDVALVRSHGALGAAIANGTAQSLALLGTWFYARRLFSLRLPVSEAVRIALSALVMAAAVMGANAYLPPSWGLPAGIALGAIVFLTLVRWTATLGQDDADRMQRARSGMPHVIQRVLALMMPVVVEPRLTPTQSRD